MISLFFFFFFFFKLKKKKKKKKYSEKLAQQLQSGFEEIEKNDAFNSNLAHLLEMGFKEKDILETLNTVNSLEYAITHLVNLRDEGLKQKSQKSLALPDEYQKLKSDRKDSGRKLTGDGVIYSTYSCLLDINSPSIYFFPRHFTAPLFKIDLPKFLVVADYTLPPPYLEVQEKPICPLEEKNEPTFPDKREDFSFKKYSPGLGLQITKLQVFIFPFGIYYAADGKDQIRPILEFDESSLGILIKILFNFNFFLSFLFLIHFLFFFHL